MDRSAWVNPSLCLGLTRTSRPAILFNLALKPGERAVAGIGLAWPQRKAWVPYMRAYPAQKSLEAGIAGNGWRLRVLGNDWLWDAPKRATVEISASLALF